MPDEPQESFETIAVKVSVELAQDLRELAECRGMPLEDFVARLIAAYLERARIDFLRDASRMGKFPESHES